MSLQNQPLNPSLNPESIRLSRTDVHALDYGSLVLFTSGAFMTQLPSYLSETCSMTFISQWGLGDGFTNLADLNPAARVVAQIHKTPAKVYSRVV